MDLVDCPFIDVRELEEDVRRGEIYFEHVNLVCNLHLCNTAHTSVDSSSRMDIRQPLRRLQSNLPRHLSP
jgi:hypothetical protein